jgi:hypothetical protein
MSVDLTRRHAGAATGTDSYTLDRGPRVRLRPVRTGDLESLRTLAAKGGVYCEDLELARLIRSDPNTRMVLCATPVSGPSDAVLGIGVIELGHSVTMPSLVLVDAELTEGLGGLIADALIERARAYAAAQVA